MLIIGGLFALALVALAMILKFGVLDADGSRRRRIFPRWTVGDVRISLRTCALLACTCPQTTRIRWTNIPTKWCCACVAGWMGIGRVVGDVGGMGNQIARTEEERWLTACRRSQIMRIRCVMEPVESDVWS